MKEKRKKERKEERKKVGFEDTAAVKMKI